MPDAPNAQLDARFVETGASPRGWSKIGCFFKCPFKYAYHYELAERYGLKQGDHAALLRGSLGHTGLAVYYERLRRERLGLDTTGLLEPLHAMAAYAVAHPEAEQHLADMQRVVDLYLRNFPGHMGSQILLVESLCVAVIGWVEGKYGLWLVPEAIGEVITQTNGNVSDSALVDLRGRPIIADRIRVENSPRNGFVIFATRRLDITFMDAAGGVWEADHKFKAKVGAYVGEEYEDDGQFGMARWFGAQRWGDRFRGCMLNAIQSRDNFKVERPVLPAKPFPDAMLPSDIAEAEQRRAWLEVNRDPWWWPRTREEQVCKGRYGRCDASKFGYCANGPSGNGE